MAKFCSYILHLCTRTTAKELFARGLCIKEQKEEKSCQLDESRAACMNHRQQSSWSMETRKTRKGNSKEYATKRAEQAASDSWIFKKKKNSMIPYYTVGNPWNSIRIYIGHFWLARPALLYGENIIYR